MSFSIKARCRQSSDPTLLGSGISVNTYTPRRVASASLVSHHKDKSKDQEWGGGSRGDYTVFYILPLPGQVQNMENGLKQF